MSTSTLADLKPGDRVQVFDVNGSRMGQPKGGWDGTVVKVGRKLITVVYDGSRGGLHGEGEAFRIDSGQRNDQYGHQHIETVEQAAEGQRRSDALIRLRANGLELTHWSKITTDALEAVVAILDQHRESQS